MRVKDCVTAEHAHESTSEAELAEHRRRLIHRHIAWLTTLRHAMRQPRPWETFHQSAANREWSETMHIPERDESLPETLGPLLASDEQQRILSSTNPSAALIFEQSRHLRELKERGLVWDFAFLDMQATLQSSLDLQGKSERIKNFPYPRQYATLSYQFVRLFVLFIPFAALPEFESIAASLEVEWPRFGRHFVWMAIPFSALISWLFHVMERIGRAGENPFEGTANDAPISTMSRGIEIDLREMLGESADMIPEPLPAPRGVQM